MIVMKFGGTSVQDAQAIKRVISIVKNRLNHKPLVVVSAMAKVTRALLTLAEDAAQQRQDAVALGLDNIRQKHIDEVSALLTGDLLVETIDKLDKIFSELKAFVEGVCQIGELSHRSRAKILSFGEILSSVIVCAAFNENLIKCQWLDARRLIVTDDNYLSARPDTEVTKANIQRIVPVEYKGCDVVITQGFIASAYNGATTVLGFEGSDYSAALFAMALAAQRVEIWTDVDGMRTADPRVVKVTSKIDKISYEEAAEMAFLGARVLHPLTIDPARNKNIPIFILNSSNPTGEGSVVVKDEVIVDGPKSIAFKQDIDYIEVDIDNFSGITANLNQIFNVLNSNKLEISLLSISPSKIAFTLESGQTLAEEAYTSLSNLIKLTLYRDKGQISITGKNVAKTPNLIDNLNNLVPKIYLRSNSANLMNVSIVVDKDKVVDIVNNLHINLFS